MNMKLIVAATMFLGILLVGSAGAQQVAADEQEFQQLVVARKPTTRRGNRPSLFVPNKASATIRLGKPNS